MSRSNSAGEASLGEHVSRSGSEPCMASLRKSGVASLPEKRKPDIGGEAMGESSRRTFRGCRGQRAWKDRSRNLGDPA